MLYREVVDARCEIQNTQIHSVSRMLGFLVKTWWYI